MKRARRRPPNNALAYRWSERERDFQIFFPSSPDGHLCHSFFAGHADHDGAGPRFLHELERRGYDLKTINFEALRTDEGLRRREAIGAWRARLRAGEATLDDLARAAAGLRRFDVDEGGDRAAWLVLEEIAHRDFGILGPTPGEAELQERAARRLLNLRAPEWT